MINILLIDDDDAAHIYHKVMIEEADIEVNSVNSAYTVDEAIQYLKSVKETDKWPHYIFIDLNMPIKSGYDFITELNELLDKTKVPELYFVSSTKNPKDIARAESIDILKGFETKFLEKEFFENLLGDN